LKDEGCGPETETGTGTPPHHRLQAGNFCGGRNKRRLLLIINKRKQNLEVLKSTYTILSNPPELI